MVVRVRRVTASADLTVGRTVDWGFAATVGQWLARPGPPSTDYTRRQAVENLATAAKAAEPPVREGTGPHTKSAGRGAGARNCGPAGVYSGARGVDAGDDRRNGQAARRDQRTGHRSADRGRAGIRFIGHPRSVRPVQRWRRPVAGLPERHRSRAPITP